MVAYYTSVAPGPKFEFLVGCWNISSPESAWLNKNIRGSCIRQLHRAGFRVVYLIGDGAGENRGLFGGAANISAADILPKSVRDKYGNIDFTREVAFPHPCNKNWYVYVLPDWPHVIKRLVNSMDASGNPRLKRQMCKDGKPISLAMLYNVWKAAGGASVNQLSVNKFSVDHFIKNNWSKMRVYLSTQVRYLVEACTTKPTHTHIEPVPLPTVYVWA